MPAEIDITGFRLSLSDKQLLSDGVLSDDVYVQFVCQTTDGGHDPSGTPDDRVRPSHAAFHGRIFKMEDAPVPPLDYGCRCAIRYVAAPNTLAEKMLPDTATVPPTTPADATGDWLNANVSDLDTLRRSAAAATTRSAIATVTAKAKKLGIAQPRSIAQMVIDWQNGGG